MKRGVALALCALVGCVSADRPSPSTTDASVEEDASIGRPPFTKGASTLAGWSLAGTTDGSRDVNLFNNPVNVALGSDGLLYVADFDNNRLRAVDRDGAATTILALPQLIRPFGLVFVGSTLFIQTDDDPDRVHSSMTGTLWEVDLGARSARWVARDIGRPRGLAALHDGRIAMADYVHHVVQIFDPATGTVEHLAGGWDVIGDADGPGADARFSSPYALVQRSDGKLLVTDFANNRIRLVGLDGTVTTLAGSDGGYRDGPLATARFDHPQGIAIDSAGDVFLTDLGSFRVRRIRGDDVTTVAGNGAAGYQDADDPLQASFYGLEGIAVSSDGSTLFLADGTRGEDVPYNRIRSVKLVP